jgi:hypothetical protein
MVVCACLLYNARLALEPRHHHSTHRGSSLKYACSFMTYLYDRSFFSLRSWQPYICYKWGTPSRRTVQRAQTARQTPPYALPRAATNRHRRRGGRTATVSSHYLHIPSARSPTPWKPLETRQATTGCYASRGRADLYPQAVVTAQHQRFPVLTIRREWSPICIHIL